MKFTRLGAVGNCVGVGIKAKQQNFRNNSGL